MLNTYSFNDICGYIGISHNKLKKIIKQSNKIKLNKISIKTKLDRNSFESVMSELQYKFDEDFGVWSKISDFIF